jgi:hypothetical protein
MGRPRTRTLSPDAAALKEGDRGRQLEIASRWCSTTPWDGGGDTFADWVQRHPFDWINGVTKAMAAGGLVTDRKAIDVTADVHVSNMCDAEMQAVMRQSILATARALGHRPYVRLVVETEDGHRSVLATWPGGGGGPAMIEGASEPVDRVPGARTRRR